MNVQKTPVSMLQEMMVKRGTAPNYELILDGGGTHENKFTYQVTCIGLSATGTGRCKKDAKHEAATAMLEVIAKHQSLPQLPASPIDSPVRTPLPMSLPECPKASMDAPFHNAIGELQVLCATNNLNDPEYREVGDIGPAHARIFTILCVVSTFEEQGVARTKKQAKHIAAQNMIRKISGVVSEDPSNLTKGDKNKIDEEKSRRIAIAKYPELTVNQTELVKSKISWGLKLKDYHKKLKNSLEDEKRRKLLEKLTDWISSMDPQLTNFDEMRLQNVKQEFSDSLKEADIMYTENYLESSSRDIILLDFQLHTAPDIHEIGIGRTKLEAEISALFRVMNTMSMFLQ
ncbi:hypothetical protein QAD02_004151 [Eretmocerus hayati]|uniref:Uncharacterized protein n=1 Tax=Eretmocerus hayati TaxID=131215 RepID=A0ACC2NNX9_9HYME|nr:hypothetical protein QAD02_004151 [Eretmocerus hayati]